VRNLMMHGAPRAPCLRVLCFAHGRRGVPWRRRTLEPSPRGSRTTARPGQSPSARLPTTERRLRREWLAERAWPKSDRERAALRPSLAPRRGRTRRGGPINEASGLRARELRVPGAAGPWRRAHKPDHFLRRRIEPGHGPHREATEDSRADGGGQQECDCPEEVSTPVHSPVLCLDWCAVDRSSAAGSMGPPSCTPGSRRAIDP